MPGGIYKQMDEQVSWCGIAALLYFFFKLVVNYSIIYMRKYAFWSSLSKPLTQMYFHKLKTNLEMFPEHEKDILAATQISQSYLACVMAFR